MELEKIDVEGINYIYAISSVKKEFKKPLMNRGAITLHGRDIKKNLWEIWQFLM